MSFTYEIRPRREWFVFVLLPVWLTFWTGVEIGGVQQFIEKPDWSLGVFVVLWSVAGPVMLSFLLWEYLAPELVTLSPTTLSITRSLVGFTRKREFELAHVRNLRLATEELSRRRANKMGNVAFYYGEKTIRFGAAASEDEAREIIRDLRSRHVFAD